MKPRIGISPPGALARIALAAVALLMPPAAARAGDLVCKPNYDFCVEVDGGFPGGARFFETFASQDGSLQRQRKYLIDIPSKGDGFLMDLPEKKIFVVPRSRMSPVDDGNVKLQDGPPETAYAFSIDGPIVEFQAQKTKVRVMPVLRRPPLVGEVTLDALVLDRAEYAAGMKQYSPVPAAMTALSKYAKPIELEVYFATWCPHCKVFMPKLLRVIKDANNPNLKLSLVGVPKEFGKEKGPWQKPDIQTIPTVIVKADGREITRLGTQEGAIPELELADILKVLK